MKQNQNSQGPEKSDVDTQIKTVLSKSPSSSLPKSNRVALSLLAGFGGAMLGAVLWFAIAAIFKIQIGYIAILVGLAVGFAMKFVLKEINLLPLGIAAALLSVLGIIMGSFMIWYFQMPVWVRQEVIANQGITEEQAKSILTDDLVRSEFTFQDYMSNDLFSFEEGNNPLVSWLFYVIALYIGFTRVYSFKKNTGI